ncbi:MAG: phosphotransferase [Propionibacteriales bacterium]|nr:phosphotransferase [Propionibacteriales bacterium]
MPGSVTARTLGGLELLATDGGETVDGDDARAEPRIVEVAINKWLADGGQHLFPARGGTSTITLRALSVRPQCALYVGTVGGGSGVSTLVAKVRGHGPSWRGDLQSRGRPRLRRGSATASELTTLEYGGLRNIYTTFGMSHPEFGVVRPLGHLVEESTILMDYVEASTLREVFMAESRLRLSSRSALRTEATRDVWRRAGAWLRMFHQSTSEQSAPASQSNRQDVIDLFHAYHDFLSTRLGTRAVGDIARRGAVLAASVLPEQLPLVVGHGDYAPRNMFVSSRGRLSVFDPMPRWKIPCYEDVCRFLVALRLLGLQVHTHGAAYSQHELERRESDVIAAYFAPDAAPLDQLRCYQLLILLDKWSAVIDSSNQGWRPRLQTASMRLASGYLRRQAQRLIELSHS